MANLLKSKCLSFFGIVFKIVGLILIVSDFGSDLWVGINLFNQCHYNYAAISLTLTALPTILVVLFVLVTFVMCPNSKDGLSTYWKESRYVIRNTVLNGKSRLMHFQRTWPC